LIGGLEERNILKNQTLNLFLIEFKVDFYFAVLND
jgi:hypothetical protein